MPVIFGRSEANALWTWLWLVLATGVAVWLVALAPVLSSGLQRLLARAPARTGQRALEDHGRLEIARLLVAAAYLVVVQAIARRPLVVALGSQAEPFVVEACLAVVALLALMLLMGWIHQSARPVVEGLAWLTLDALLATTGSEAAAAQAEASRRSSTAPPPTRVAGRDETAQPTLASPTLVVSTRALLRRTPRD